MGTPVGDEVERRWTQTDVNQLRLGSSEGQAAAALASTLGRTESAVRIMARRLAIKLG